MAEIKTTLAEKLGTKNKLSANEAGGRVRVIATRLPSVHAQQSEGTTILIGEIPAGARMLSLSSVICGDGNENAKLDVGFRIPGGGDSAFEFTRRIIAADVDISTAGVKPLNTGSFFSVASNESVMPGSAELVATVTGAALKANQGLKFEIYYVID